MDTESMKSIIAQNIVSLRRESKLTQLEFAERLNYSDKAVSKWERAESVPDIFVLKEIADMFGVSVDYLLCDEHNEDDECTPTKREEIKIRNKNRKIICLMSIVLVWLVALLSFTVIDSVDLSSGIHWLAYVYAVPVSCIVWLVFNSVWFNSRINYIIISVLMWSVLASLYLTLTVFGINIWLLFVLGVPGQIIIVLWSKITRQNTKKPNQY